jgi:predicted DNA-binding protein YlxM (UPF0122 family)
MVKKRNTIHFSCEDIAEAKGVTIHAVYSAIKRGKLNVSDLNSIVRYIVLPIEIKWGTNKPR